MAPQAHLFAGKGRKHRAGPVVRLRDDGCRDIERLADIGGAVKRLNDFRGTC